MLFRQSLRCSILALLIVGLLSSLIAFARPVSFDEAFHIANHYLQVLPLESDLARTVGQFKLDDYRVPDNATIIHSTDDRRRSDAILDAYGSPLAYVFELDPLGFLVISADTRLHPLIAYSVECWFPWHTDIDNPLLNALRFDLCSRLRTVDRCELASETRFDEQWAELLAQPAGTASVNTDTANGSTPGYLEHATPIMIDMTLDWHQGPSFNDLCKTTDGNPAKAGCVAIAISQVLAYHGEKVEVSLGVESPMMFEFPDLSILSTWGQLDDLVHYAGELCDTHYDEGVSTAMMADAATSLATPWGYGSGVAYHALNTLSAAKNLYDALHADSEAGLPILLCLAGRLEGAGEGSGNVNHAVVADGRRNSSPPEMNTFYLHLRMGSLDSTGSEIRAWYSLPALEYFASTSDTQGNTLPPLVVIEGIFHIDPLTANDP